MNHEKCSAVALKAEAEVSPSESTHKPSGLVHEKMMNRDRCRLRCRAAPSSLASLLFLAFLLCTQHVSVTAFGRKKAETKEKGAAATSAEEIAKEAETQEATKSESATSADDDVAKEADTNKSQSSVPVPTENSNTQHGQQQQPSTPPAILEAEARTARELSKAVGKLTSDLNTCNVRVNAIEQGFQDLYAAHLGNVDGLRKCKEGVLTAQDMDDLGSSLDRVNPALIEQAKSKEDDKKRNARTEELSRKHRELIHQLDDQIEKLVKREKTWERTISELVARRDLLEKREGAWERTIGELMGEIEIRAMRENWWEDMKVDMEGED